MKRIDSLWTPEKRHLAERNRYFISLEKPYRNISLNQIAVNIVEFQNCVLSFDLRIFGQPSLIRNYFSTIDPTLTDDDLDSIINETILFDSNHSRIAEELSYLKKIELPNELIEMILMNLPYWDLKNVWLVSRQLASICRNKNFQQRYNEYRPLPLCAIKWNTINYTTKVIEVGDENHITGYLQCKYRDSGLTKIINYINIIRSNNDVKINIEINPINKQFFLRMALPSSPVIEEVFHSNKELSVLIPERKEALLKYLWSIGHHDWFGCSHTQFLLYIYEYLLCGPLSRLRPSNQNLHIPIDLYGVSDFVTRKSFLFNSELVSEEETGPSLFD